jgi:hypothetical protein
MPTPAKKPIAPDKPKKEGVDPDDAQIEEPKDDAFKETGKPAPAKRPTR